ncbi:MAG: TetR/AcrR family transcriptional regulator [Polyangiaceae bacterium]
MVALLLDAAEHEIGVRGLANTTTNHVAARAGVSIGSLYQYFQDQQALVDAIQHRNVARLITALDERIKNLDEMSEPRVLVRVVLEAVFDAVEKSPLQRELLRDWQSLRRNPAFVALERHVTEVCRRYLVRHHDQYKVDNLTVALFVGVNSVQYTVAHYLSLRDPPLGRDEVIGGLVDMLTAYLGLSRRA